MLFNIARGVLSSDEQSLVSAAKNFSTQPGCFIQSQDRSKYLFILDD